MSKVLVTYRATIDRYVPIAVRSRIAKARLPIRSKFFIIRDRIRVN